MASREFHEYQARAAAQAPAAPPASIAELRARIDAALGSVPLERGVSERRVDAGGVSAIALERDGGERDPLLLYFHGGGYRIGSAHAWRAYASRLAAACRARVWVVDYRLAPEHPFPAAIDDAVCAYRALLARGESPARVVLAGDSAGGGLAAAALIALARESLPRPAGAVCLSPWADLSNRADSYRTRAHSDKLFGHKQAEEAAALYLAGHAATDPLASPLFADWTGQASLLIHAGDAEVLLDDATGLAERARAAGVDVRLSVYPEMPHVWHLAYPAFPEAVRAVEEIAGFVRERTGGALSG
jgi:acetyl esterase/lipase